MHAVRSAARPKLSLAVPSAAIAKPTIPTLIIPAASSSVSTFSRPAASPLTPTARNTALNARASASLHVPAFSAASRPKKHAGKKVSFAERESVTLISPCPRDYYGDYVTKTREERRWSRSD